jgi:hypothetical protein
MERRATLKGVVCCRLIIDPAPHQPVAFPVSSLWSVEQQCWKIICREWAESWGDKHLLAAKDETLVWRADMSIVELMNWWKEDVRFVSI